MESGTRLLASLQSPAEFLKNSRVSLSEHGDTFCDHGRAYRDAILAEARLVQVLKLVGVTPRTWYRPSLDESLRKRPGPPPKPVSEEAVKGVVFAVTVIDYYSRYLLAWMPTDQKKPNRTAVRFHGFSAMVVGLPQVVWFIYIPISPPAGSLIQLR